MTKLVLKYNLMLSLKFLVICYLYLGVEQSLSLSINSKFAKGSTRPKSLGNPHIVTMKSKPNKVNSTTTKESSKVAQTARALRRSWE